MSVFITDYIVDPEVEKKILSGRLTENPEEAEVLLVWHQIINKRYLSKFPNLKGIVRYGVGFDAIDLQVVKDLGLIFCNTPDYGTDEVSDTVIGMMMNIVRGITIYDQNSRNYRDQSWQENTIKSLKRTNTLTLGVIGAGRIGGSVLRKAKAIGFNVKFYDPYKERGYEKMLGAERLDSMIDLLQLSDIISINTPLTAETSGMVDETFLSNMKDGSSFINTARGEIVSNLDIFFKPLKSGRLAAIALDVLPEEPPAKGSLIKAWKKNEDWILGKVIINPHTAYYSSEAYKEMREKAAINAKRILDNEEPHNVISI